LSICEAASEAERDRKRWGKPATIVVDNDDETSCAACTDAVSGKRFFLRNMFLTDSYDEAYLRVIGLDFISKLMYSVYRK